MRQLSEHITSFGYAVNFPHIGIVVRISEKKSFPCQPILPLYCCHIIQAEKPLSVRLYGMCQTVYHSHIPLHHLQLFQTLFLLRYAGTLYFFATLWNTVRGSPSIII